MNKHTATPWTEKGPYIEANNETICQCFQFSGGREASLSNAAFIVKAVNSHDQLVRALRAAKTLFSALDIDIMDCADYGNGEHAYKTIESINSALEAVEAA